MNMSGVESNVPSPPSSQRHGGVGTMIMVVVITVGVAVLFGIIFMLRSMRMKRRLLQKRSLLNEVAMTNVKNQIRALLTKYERERLQPKPLEAADDTTTSNEDIHKTKQEAKKKLPSGELSNAEHERFQCLMDSLPSGLRPMILFRNDLKRRNNVYKNTLSKIYRQKAPEKLEFIDNILENVEGAEEQFISQMRKKYYVQHDETGAGQTAQLARQDSVLDTDVESPLPDSHKHSASTPTAAAAQIRTLTKTQDRAIPNAVDEPPPKPGKKMSPSPQAQNRSLAPCDVSDKEKDRLLQKQMDVYGQETMQRKPNGERGSFRPQSKRKSSSRRISTDNQAQHKERNTDAHLDSVTGESSGEPLAAHTRCNRVLV